MCCAVLAALVAWTWLSRAREKRPAYDREQAGQLKRLLAKFEGDLIMAEGTHKVLVALHARVEFLEQSNDRLEQRVAELEQTRPAEQ